jgi:uncharacterized lipoprotein YmbA
MSPAGRAATSCAALLGAGLLYGCALFDRTSVPVNHYLLSAVSDDASPTTAAGGPVFAVAPVRVPDYLNQKPFVTKTGENEIKLADNDQWAAPLADQIADVLSENLTAMIPSKRVVQIPVSASVPVDYEIRVEIVSFERQPDGSIRLVARWSVLGDRGRQAVTVSRSAFRVGNVPDSYAATAAAMSSLLGELSREVSEKLRTAPLTS